MKAASARKNRIDDHALASRHFAHHFVAHDERIAGRNCPSVDFQVGSAQSTVCDAHQNVTAWDLWWSDVVER
jgi:hypothetical protein